MNQPKNATLLPMIAIGFVLVSMILAPSLVSGEGMAQTVPTVDLPSQNIPTVTGTPIGTYIVVNSDQDQINVRECPNATTCAIVGVLIAGQEVPAKGRTEGGVWIQIEFHGVPGGLAWVHSSLVTLYGGSLQAVEPPATPTPAQTATIDPTLAAQFIVTIQPTRLPTYTPPPDLVIPTFEEVNGNTVTAKVPMGMIITGLAVLGIFGGILSVLRGR